MATISSRELTEQMEFDAGGYDETWLQTGTIAAAVYNAQGAGETVKPKSFIPMREQHEQQTAAEMEAALRAALGGFR